MKRFLAGLVLLMAVPCAIGAGFDFRTTGTTTTEVFNFRGRNTAPSIAEPDFGKLYYDKILQQFRISQNGGVYVNLFSAGGGTVVSFNGRTGPVVSQIGDYTATQTTNTPAGSIAATNVQAAVNELDGDVALKATLASPTLTGVPAAPTAAGGTNTTQLATTAFVQGKTAAQTPSTATGDVGATDVQAAIAELASEKETVANMALKAPIASPSLTGNPLSVTPIAADNDTSIATTAWAQTEFLTPAEGNAAYAETATGNTFTGDQVITGKVGTGMTPIHALDVRGAAESGIGLYDPTNPGSAATESFLADFAYTSSVGRQVKRSSISSKWGSAADSNGYGILDLNAAYMVATVQTDDVFLRAYGNQGVNFFDPSATPPGLDVLRVAGSVVATGDVTSSGLWSTQTSNSTADVLKMRNLSNSTSAAVRILLGNDASAYASTITQYSSTHSTKPNYLEIQNQFNAPLTLNLDGGNVGIGGTPAAGAKLQVNGNIYTNSFTGGNGKGIFLRDTVPATAQPSVTVTTAFGANADGLRLNGYSGVGIYINDAQAMSINSSLAMAVAGSVSERSRTVPMGEWTTPTFAAGNFTSDPGTWVVEAADVTTYAYMLVGKSMTLSFIINSTTVTGTPTSLRISIPGGFTAVKYMDNAGNKKDNGGISGNDMTIESSVGANYVTLLRDYGSTAWTASTNATSVRGQITFEIQFLLLFWFSRKRKQQIIESIERMAA